jgi:hypothetical protein
MILSLLSLLEKISFGKHAEWEFYTQSVTALRVNFDMHKFNNDTLNCDFNTHKSGFYTQIVIYTQIYTRCDLHTQCAIWHSQLWFQHAQEWFLHVEGDFGTYECDYDTHEYDYDTHK